MFLKAATYELTKLIYIGSGAMILLAISIVVFILYYQRKVQLHQLEIKILNDQKQLELIQASLQGEEEERMRIALELHDDVCITLTSLKLFIKAMSEHKADANLAIEAQEILDESIIKVRNISHKLQPAMLQQLGLHASLDSFATLINNMNKVEMSYSGKLLPRYPENIELAVYRMVQELTNNIIKHANAKAIHLNTQHQANKLQIILDHNGAGLTQETFNIELNKKGAIGLKNIVNRLKSIRASIAFEHNGKEQYSILITIPIDDPIN